MLWVEAAEEVTGIVGYLASFGGYREERGGLGGREAVRMADGCLQRRVKGVLRGHGDRILPSARCKSGVILRGSRCYRRSLAPDGGCGRLRRAVAAQETLRSPPPRVEVRGSGRGMAERPLAAAPPAELPARVGALFGLQLELRATTPLCAKTRDHLGKKPIEYTSSSRYRPVFLILSNDFFISKNHGLRQLLAACHTYIQCNAKSIQRVTYPTPTASSHRLH